MATIGFCGTGQMGAPMAARLVEAGLDVAVWNRSAARAAPLVDAGARWADSPRDAAAGAATVITMLATPEALEAVVFGGDGVRAGLEGGATLVEMSTVGPAAVRSVAARLPAGVSMLDAPVLGSVPQATDGTLKLFVGGDDEVVERHRGVLALLGRVDHLGPLGAGAAMKLVVNSTLGALMAGLAEAMVLGDAFGLDQGAVLDVLADSPIGATARGKRSRIESDRYPPNFKLALAAKDLRLVVEAAEAAGAEPRLAAAARSWFEDAARAGLGALDYSAVIAHARGREAAGPDAE
ncbi:MAG TPA: NAD(P)-dependent oxidoreductase [Acidimicrobiales bacterium]|nr:NAD(P)-dependent oxidoreductase [Acidimicrobiales bacterium]